MGTTSNDPEETTWETKLQKLRDIYEGKPAASVPDPALYQLLRRRAVLFFNGKGRYGVHPLGVELLREQLAYDPTFLYKGGVGRQFATRGTGAWLVRALRDWIVSVQQGMALVTYLSSASREHVLSELSSQLQTSGLTTQILACEKLSAENFIDAISKSDADVLFVLDPDRVIFGKEPESNPFWINFHRETLVARPGVQIWWLPPSAAIRFSRELPDLNRFFLFREDLKTTTQIERETSLKFQISYSPEPLADDRGPDYLRRALKAVSSRRRAENARIWLELGIPALEAFTRSGQIAEAMQASEELTAAIGSAEEALNRLTAIPDCEKARGFLTLATLDRLVALERKGSTEYLKLALRRYEKTLALLPGNTCPEIQAAARYGMGNAYWFLGRDKSDDSLQRAIDCFTAALEIYTEQSFPWDWARTQNSLGASYGALQRGDVSYNLRRAIACYEAALRVRTEQKFPKDWAQTQSNLGIAYHNLPTGERAENLGRAIEYYEAALRVYTEHEFPEDWAQTQLNLGRVYDQLFQQVNGADTLLRAIGYCNAELRVFTESEFPEEWADTQAQLGHVYADGSLEDGTGNLGRAKDCYEAALRVFTRRDSPEDWAWTLIQPALVYTDLPGNRSANIGRAIAFCRSALQVYTEQAFPLQWTAIQNYLKHYADVEDQ